MKQKKKLYSIIKKSLQFKKDLNVDQDALKYSGIATEHAKKVKEIAKKSALKNLHTNWEQKALHGKFPERAAQADVDKSSTYSWLKSSTLKIETEGFILAAQEQSLKTKNYLKNIMKVTQDSSCRFCKQQQETIDHIVSGCPTLAVTEYLIRHNKVAKYVHWKICQHYGITVNQHWYEHETPPVVENNEVTILWDFSIQTDRTIKANRPDIVVRDKKKENMLVIGCLHSGRLKYILKHV